MNIKEAIISSLFSHLILFLLMIAASHYTTEFPGGVQNIISVELAREDARDQQTARSGSADELRSDSRPPAETESLPEQDVGNPPEEPMKEPEAEQKDEAADQPEKIEKIEQTAIQREGFSSLEAYYQFIAIHKKVFGQQAGVRVNNLLGAALRVNKREFYGGTGMISLSFGLDGRLVEAHVDSESPSLKEFLEEIDWSIIPAPTAYSLGFTGVQIEFTVREGYMSFNIIIP